MEYSQEQIRAHAQALRERVSHAGDMKELEELRTGYLGRSGVIAQLTAELKTMSLDQKRLFAPEIQHFRAEAEGLINAKIEGLRAEAERAQRERSALFDVTAYRPGQPVGSLHPATQTIEQIENILIAMGFEIVEGPEVEDEECNFEALNVPANHPARDLQDTFWLPHPHMLLRTHTSSVQIRGMRQRQPPLALAATGRTYRHEATDASHDFVFMQCEGLVVDRKISMANLLATMKQFLQALFEKDQLDIRVRPNYFPFVEPGIEIDMTCPFCAAGCSVCKQTRLIEICGAGLVHPHVLRAGGINPDEYSGFAFGFGLTRLVMLRYGIQDVRLLHSGKIEFLKQF
ncbi:MAG: phenylalanine--tRNA ligase subunit alpha [Candidatus Dependentiae bacterium]|nr:phenylalanine--tRNA ligase subunit alpha [Candidatus Dependentiae bacterium]